MVRFEMISGCNLVKQPPLVAGYYLAFFNDCHLSYDLSDL